jgi:hypothetical protein
VQVEGDVKLEEMDGEENPVDMRNVFPPNINKIKIKNNFVRSRVSVPDPHGSELQ